MADLQTPRKNDTRCNLIINYLPQSLSDKEFNMMFLSIGPLNSCRIMRDNQTGYSFGYGFVEFQNAVDAAKAIRTLNGLKLQHKTLKVSYSRDPDGKSRKNTNLYITNLPKHIDETELDNVFGQYGTIIQRHILKDKVTNTARGIAFVRFNTTEEAQAAIEGLHGAILVEGVEPLCVKVAEEHGKQKAAMFAGVQTRGMGGPFRGGRGGMPRGRGSAAMFAAVPGGYGGAFGGADMGKSDYGGYGSYNSGGPATGGFDAAYDDMYSSGYGSYGAADESYGAVDKDYFYGGGDYSMPRGAPRGRGGRGGAAMGGFGGAVRNPRTANNRYDPIGAGGGYSAYNNWQEF